MKNAQRINPSCQSRRRQDLLEESVGGARHIGGRVKRRPESFSAVEVADGHSLRPGLKPDAVALIVVPDMVADVCAGEHVQLAALAAHGLEVAPRKQLRECDGPSVDLGDF